MSDTTTTAEATQSPEAIGRVFFKYRDYTPIPLIILLLMFAKPTVITATLGLVTIMFGELIRVYSVAFIGSISRTRKDNTGSHLIRTGPFSYVRNPLYVGNFFITAGVAIFGGSYLVLFLAVALFCTQYHFVVKYEESILRQKFGPEYVSYCQDVPPWFPKRSIKLEDMEWPNNFTPAIRSERRTLTTIVVLVVILALMG